MKQDEMKQPDAGRLWNVDEAARYLGVSVKFLERDRAGPMKIKFAKIGKHVRYDPADLSAYKDRCKFGGLDATRG